MFNGLCGGREKGEVRDYGEFWKMRRMRDFEELRIDWERIGICFVCHTLMGRWIRWVNWWVNRWVKQVSKQVGNVVDNNVIFLD